MVGVDVGDPKGEVSRGGGDGVRAKAKAKKALVGAGARVLFYPTLFYNVIRNKVEAEFHWWDEVDQFVLLGAVPFPADVPRLQQYGVRGVITLNEPYETLVPSSLYKAHGIDHLVIPTRDYLFAPSLADICQAVDFIHGNASCGRTTYVHCKAGRGRSTTVVLCYLVEYKNMTPAAALEHVRSRRPRVLLAPSQWRAVEEYSRRKLELPALQSLSPKHLLAGDEVFISEADFEDYDIVEDDDDSTMIMNQVQDGPIGGDEVFISETDLEGYSIVESKGISPIIVNHVQEGYIGGDGDLSGDEVLISKADLEDYNIVGSKEPTPMIDNHPDHPIGGNEVLVTEADLEGHEAFTNGSHEQNHPAKETANVGNTLRWFSCICTSLKFSASSQIQKIHAC